MADAKLTDLAANTAPTSDDLVYVVDDPGGTPADTKTTIAQLAGSAPFSSLYDAQTPWTSAIDGDGYALADVGSVAVGTQALTANTGVQVGRTLTGLTTFHYGFVTVDNLSFTSPTLFHAFAAFRSQPTIAVTAGALTSLYGVYHAPTVSGAGAVTQAAGGYFGITSNGTVTTGYGIQIGSTSGSGTIGTMVGLEILSLSAGTTKWGMQVGDYQSYHQGALSVGHTAAPSAYLHVSRALGIGSEIVRIASGGITYTAVERTFQHQALTTDATPNVQTIITLASSTTALVETKVSARRTGGASGAAEDGAGYVFYSTFKNVAGTATQIGSTTAAVTHESVAGWAATHGVSGQDIRLSFTGAATTNITWTATTRVYYHQN
jgi:hypothetical protein